MKAILPSLLMPLLVLPGARAMDATANRRFSCPVAPGVAALHIDGSLSEWNPQIAKQTLRWSGGFTHERDDSNATVRCLADDAFLYLGIAVDANAVRFGDMPFNQAWRNDAVEVFVSSQARSSSPYIRSGLIRVSGDSSGRTITEGSASIADGDHTTRKFSYPFLWEALGIGTGLQITPGGYTVEIAIPKTVMGWAQTGAAPALSINVRVRRRCGERPCESTIQLIDDPNNSSPRTEERFWPVFFMPQLPTGNSPEPSGNGAIRALAYRALLRLDTSDPDGALAVLAASPDQWLLPIMGGALMAAGRFDSAIYALSGLSQGTPEEASRLWAVEQMAYCHSLLGDRSLGRQEYTKLIATGDPAYQDIGVAGLIDPKNGS